MTSSFDLLHMDSDGEASTYRISAESKVILAPPSSGSAGGRHQGSGAVRQTFWDGQNIGASIAYPAPADTGSLSVKGQISESAISNLRIMPSIMPTMMCTAIGEGNVPVAMPVLWPTCMYAMHEDETDAQARTDDVLIQGWQMSAQGEILASKSYVRQQSFPAGGGSDLISENTQLRIHRLPNLPYVRPIRAMGIGTHENRPETGSEVRMCAEIDESAIYELERCYWSGELASGDGTVAAASRTVALASGQQAMPLSFSGTEIAGGRLDGPYALENVSLRDVTGLRLDHASSPYTTTIPYGHQEFLCGEGFLDVSRASDQAVDLDQEGFFDQLDITVAVVAHDYVGMRVSGTLVDAEGSAIAQAVVHPVEIMRDDPWTLTSNGTRVLTGTLSFAGSAIASHGVDGPFVLDPLTLAAMTVRSMTPYMTPTPQAPTPPTPLRPSPRQSRLRRRSTCL